MKNFKLKDDFVGGGNWLFKVVPIFIAFVFVIIIGWWILVGVVSVKIFNEIDQNGLKSTIERIWEGPSKDKK